MPKGFYISEETPDRQYFTIVPNYIVNHSTVWEQAVYLTMKRIAGEDGSCYATHQTLASRLKISRPTVSKTIKSLLKRQWVKEVGTRKGKTHPIKEYKIIDLWKQNVDFYSQVNENSEICKPENISFRKDTSTTEPKIRKPGLHRRRSYIEEDINTPSIISPKYSSLEDIRETDLVEISERYHLPAAFVKLCLEKMTNWLEAKGKTYKNYRRGLMSWVLSEAQSQMERRGQDDKKRAIDATEILRRMDRERGIGEV